MSIVVDSVVIAGTIGNKLKKFKPSCEEISSKEQVWNIEPTLPEGLMFNVKNGIITGLLSMKYSKEHSLEVKGEGKQFSKDIQISILKPMKTNIVEYIKQLSTDNTSLGHGICEFVDNSIDAGAKRIDVRMNYEFWDNDGSGTPRPWVMVKDNGKGILSDGIVTSEALEDALGIATSPDQEYDATRLGAYGVGLPAAALTSAIYCTVFTKSGGKSAIGHMNYEDIRKNNALRFFEEEDIYDFLKNTDSYKKAVQEFDSIKDSGTIILLQDHYQIRRSIIAPSKSSRPQQFKEDFNVIKERLADYLGLIYHNFISKKGADLMNDTGKIINKKIQIWAPKKIVEIDPLMEHLNSENLGAKGTHIHFHSKADCTIRSENQWFQVKMAVIPGQKAENGIGRTLPDGRSYDKAMSNAMQVYLSQEGSSEGIAPKEMQGLYFYRNMRLIEFGGWKGMYSIAPQAQVARAAIYAPPGLPVHNPRLNVLNDFSVDQRKRDMKITASVAATIKDIISTSREWYHEDGKSTTLKSRAESRSAFDGLKKKKKVKGGKNVDKAKKAIIEPSEIETVEVPHDFTFKDLTTDIPKKPDIRRWDINGITIGHGKIINHKITEPGEKKLTLTISHKSKLWQRSIIFNCVEKEKISTMENSTHWKVKIIELSSEEPPIILDGDTYIINKANPDWQTIVRTMWLGTNDE